MSTGTLEAVRGGAGLASLVLLLVWESIAPNFPYFKDSLRARIQHGFRNLFLGLINGALNGLICAGLWWMTIAWADSQSFGLLRWIAMSDWVRWFAAFLLLDIWTYSWHRLNHQLPFLWRFHRVHHSDRYLDVTTANRFHLGEIFFSCLLRIPLVAVIGISMSELVAYELALFTVVQFHHANIRLPHVLDGLLRLVFVTPGMHQIHHSRLRQEADSNFGSLFSFWDRILQTYNREEHRGSLRFGLDELSGADCDTIQGLIKTPILPLAPQRPPHPPSFTPHS